MSYIGIIIAFLLGLSAIRMMGRFSFLESIGLSFPLGMGLATFLMFILNIVGVKLSVQSMAITILIGIILLNYSIFLNPKQFVLSLKNINLKSFFRVGRFSLIWLALVLGVLALLSFITVKSLYTPTFSTDAISSFDLYAKAIANEGTLLNSLIFDKGVGYGAAYPPLTSLSLAYSFIFGFESSKIIPALFYISFIFAFYGLALRNGTSLTAIFATFFIVVSPEFFAQSSFNTTSVPQAMYASLGIIALCTWHNTKEMKFLFLSIMLLALNGWIRSEGIVYIGAAVFYCLYIYVSERKTIRPLLLLLTSVIPFVLWQIFLKANIEVMDSFVQVEMKLVPNLDGEHIRKILAGTRKNFFSPNYYGITVYAFIVAVLFNIYGVFKKKQSVLTLGVVLIPLIGYLVLLNQLHLRADSMEAIMDASAKRFFFGIVAIMWFYIVQVWPLNKLFEGLEVFLSIPQKTEK